VFLNGSAGYRGVEQTARGDFLVLFSYCTSKSREVRACVRHVRMRQLGHFMMARARIGPHTVPLSGSYGADGLTRDPDPFPGLWEALVPLPTDLAEKFWRGGGHNSTGSEAPDLHAWGLANLRTLRRAGTPQFAAERHADALRVARAEEVRTRARVRLETVQAEESEVAP
jgi:hypothetical protein